MNLFKEKQRMIDVLNRYGKEKNFIDELPDNVSIQSYDFELLNEEEDNSIDIFKYILGYGEHEYIEKNNIALIDREIKHIKGLKYNVKYTFMKKFILVDSIEHIGKKKIIVRNSKVVAIDLSDN